MKSLKCGIVLFIFMSCCGLTVSAFELDLPGLGETGFALTESAIYRYFTDEDYVEQYEEGDDYEILNRLNLRATKGDYIIGIRFDVDINTARDEQYRLEKKFFQINKPGYSLEIGDYYYSIGRGLVLNVVKTFEDEGLEYQIEQTLLGGRFSMHGERLAGTVLGGVIEDDELDIRDTIGGATMSWTANLFNAGINVLGFSFDKEDRRSEYKLYENGGIGSLSFAVPSIGDWGSWYAEFAGLSLAARDTEDEDLNGWAIYSEMSLYLQNWTVLLEGKRYKDFIFPYHAPPLLEPEELGILAEQFNLSTRDMTGVRLRVDYSIPDTSTIVYTVLGYIDDSPEDDPLWDSYYRRISESYLGVESAFGDGFHLLSAVGYRQEDASEFTPSDYVGYTPHAFLNIKIPVTSRQAVELVGNWKHFTQAADHGFTEYDFYRQEYALAYHLSPYLAATFSYEYFNDIRAQFGGAGTDNTTDFYSVDLSIHPLDQLYVKLFYGSTPGGIKCSSGVCKTFPPFEGMRCEVIIRL